MKEHQNIKPSSDYPIKFHNTPKDNSTSINNLFPKPFAWSTSPNIIESKKEKGRDLSLLPSQFKPEHDNNHEHMEHKTSGL